MRLTEGDKENVRTVWGHVSSHAEASGAEVLNRLLVAHPTTKTYFPHIDTSPGSSDIKALGKKVVDAVTLAANNLDDIDGALAELSRLHAEKLRVDPANFPMLNHCILVTIAAHSRGSLSPTVLLSLDKFLSCVGEAMVSRYR